MEEKKGSFRQHYINPVLFETFGKLLKLYARLLGFRFIQAISETQKRECYRLRWEVYRSEGYIDPNQFSNQLMIDKYDPYSVDFIAYSKGTPIASVRLILDSPFNFPTENLFNIKKFERRNASVEIGRLSILKDYRGNSRSKKRIIMFCLAFTMYEYCRSHGLKYWIANMPEKLALSYKVFWAHFDRVSEESPTAEHIEARKVIAGYFDKQTLYPYLLAIANIPRNI